MRTKRKEKIKTFILGALVIIFFEALFLMMFVQWATAPAEQPISQAEWMEQVNRGE